MVLAIKSYRESYMSFFTTQVRLLLTGPIVLLVALSLTGCGGDDNVPPVNTDTNLSITSVSAVDSTSVAVIFSEEIDAATVLSNGSQFTFSGGAIVASAASVTNNVVIVTTGSLVSCAPYTITVDISVYAFSGNLLNTLENTFAFTALVPNSSCTAWLEPHNLLRQQLNAGLLPNSPTPAVPVDDLQWDNNLEQVAQDYADGCVFAHNPDRTTQYQTLGGTESSVGENLASSTATLNEQQFLDLWASEESVFVYEAIDVTNFGVFGHYTQLIWDNTTHIGCAISNCGSFDMAVCNYAPSGNSIGQYPY